MKKMLEVKNIKKSFGKLDVLKDISLDVLEGQVLAIIGPSGSGKSTLLRSIMNLETIDSGEINICGQTLVKNNEKGVAVYAPKKECRQIMLSLGLVFQNFNLFPHLSVLQNITYAQVKVLKTSKAEAEQIAMELLEKMGLADRADAYPYQLSGGQQQRVSIARAMALKPQVLLFDEPTSALDPELTGEILKVIRQLATEKMTMVIVTHEMNFAKNVADHVIFMDNGYIIEKGTPQEVFSESKSERIKEFLSKYEAD
ncbi:MAG: amino acid ABC transporter ATP-binding protein [Acutalibacteraceae bacterium]|nr:amino acid ABC transporter ATP-binding protein [Acutalibacteraceae bacterium]